MYVPNNGRQKYCSKCSSNLNRKSSKCLYCGKILPFERRNSRFCNDLCAAMYRSGAKEAIKQPKASYVPSIIKTCPNCGEIFTSTDKDAKFCSRKCSFESLRKRRECNKNEETS